METILALRKSQNLILRFFSPGVIDRNNENKSRFWIGCFANGVTFGFMSSDLASEIFKNFKYALWENLQTQTISTEKKNKKC